MRKVALRRDINEQLHAWNAHPPVTEFLKSLRRGGGRLSTDTVMALRDGKLVNLGAIRQLVEFQLLARNSSGTVKKRAGAFMAILAELGFKKPSVKQVNAIVLALIDSREDELTRDVDCWAKLIESQPSLPTPDGMSLTDSEINRGILSVYENVGRYFSQAADTEDIAGHCAIAEQLVGIPLAEYTERAKSWMQTCPGTLWAARSQNRLLGISIVFPLTHEAYDLVLAGKLSPTDVQPEHLTPNTTRFFIEAVGELTKNLGGVKDDNSVEVRLAIGAQISFLMDKDARDFRFMSRFVEGRNGDRVSQSGFKPTGVHEHRAGHPLGELLVDASKPGGGRTVLSLFGRQKVDFQESLQQQVANLVGSTG